MKRKKLTTADLTARLARELQLPIHTVEPFVGRLIKLIRETILESATKDEELSLQTLGVFSYTAKPANPKPVKRRHVQTKEIIELDWSGRLRFRPSRKLREDIRERIRQASAQT